MANTVARESAIGIATVLSIVLSHFLKIGKDLRTRHTQERSDQLGDIGVEVLHRALDHHTPAPPEPVVEDVGLERHHRPGRQGVARAAGPHRHDELPLHDGEGDGIDGGEVGGRHHEPPDGRAGEQPPAVGRAQPLEVRVLHAP